MTRVVVRSIAEVLAAAPGPIDWLSPTEQARLLRLQVVERRNQYLAGHWLLRQLLADHLRANPREVTLIERENLPPAVADSPLQVSLSHAGDWVAAAYSAAPIGIDLEPRTPRPALDRLQHLLLNPDEAKGSLDNDALLQRWVLKEALIKRDHASALPEQLAALQLRLVAAEAVVELLSSAAWHLALAPAGLVEVDPGLPLLARSGWALA